MSASMQWFRLYNRIVDDEKLRLLAFEDRWHFVALCCLKSTGLLDEPDSELKQRRVAVKLGVQLRELDEISRRLQAVSLIDGHLNPLAWDELQFKSDHDATAARRQREKRQRDKALKAVTDASRVTVTDVTRLEAETETEELEAKASCASDDAPAAGPILKPEHVVDEWNLVASRIGKPRVRDLTPSRRQLIRARIAQYDLSDFVSVFGRVEASPFLRGDRQWQGCTFDWVMKRANFQKIVEGNYDN